MPSGPFLYAHDFVDTLTSMAQEKKFKKMIIYEEACESGSIFKGLLPDGELAPYRPIHEYHQQQSKCM